jgi:hypothetical protein
MAEREITWKVSPYEPVRKLEDNVWLVQALIPDMPMPLKRTMTLFRLSDGRVVIHSAIALHEPDMQMIEAWGEPAILVVPNGYHRIDAPRYKMRYPKLRVFCPAPAHKKVSERVEVDGHFDTFPKDPALEVRDVEGTRGIEGVFIAHSGPGRDRTTLVFNDMFFNQPHMGGFSGTLYRWLGQSGSAQVPGIARLMFVKDKKALRAQLEALADLPGLVRIVPGHGEVMEEDVAGQLRAAAAKL